MNQNHDSLGNRMSKLTVTKGFKPIHILFLITSVFTGILGSVTHASGMAIIPSLTGVIISALTVWFVIEGWEEHKYTGKSLKVSIVLYGLAMFDEWGNMMAKGIGGAFGDFYFGPFISTSIVFVLILWVVLALFNEDYSEARENIGMARAENRAARKVQMEIVLDRIADKEEKLLKKKLARKGRRLVLTRQHGAIMRRLEGVGTWYKLKSNSKRERDALLASLDIHTQGKNAKSKEVPAASIQWSVSSGDGATASLT